MTLSINDRGHLEIGGCDCVDLARQYGTPLYVMDEDQIRRNCSRYRETMAECYPNYLVAFAGKAFLTAAMCCLVEEEGLGLDTVSGGEIYTALNTGFPPERMILHGNNKSTQEIKLALKAGVHRLVADSFTELHVLGQMATAMGVKAEIYLRVNPAIAPGTHHYIQTGQLDSKFGFGYDGQIMEAIRLVKSLPGLILRGLHCHIGSQIHDLSYFVQAAEVMMDLLARVRREEGLSLSELDLGGGLGIRYLPRDPEAAIEDYIRAVTSAVKQSAARLGLPLPRLLLEPGRSIVGESGISLYQVGSRKEVPGVRKYVAVDGGMTTDIRPALYGARYTAVVANRANAPAEERVTIAGNACESGDILIKDIDLPLLRRGDILALLSTGAYHHSMASNYNRLPRPAVVFARQGRAELVVARESYADLVKNDIVPAHMLRRSEKSGA